MTKRMIKTELIEMCNVGSVSGLVKDLTALLDQSEGELTYEVEYSEQYGEIYTEFTIYERKEESDELYQKRLAFDQLVKDKQLAKEKAEFERLKAKFGE